MQSVPITTEVLRSNLAQARRTRYNIMWFSPVFSTNNTDLHDITEILLKVALNTIAHNPIWIVTLYLSLDLGVWHCLGLVPFYICISVEQSSLACIHWLFIQISPINHWKIFVLKMSMLRFINRNHVYGGRMCILFLTNPEQSKIIFPRVIKYYWILWANNILLKIQDKCLFYSK